MPRVLITGATGFLGGYLVQELVEDYEVHALGRNLIRGRELEEEGSIFHQADFTNYLQCQPHFTNIDYVIHAGALSTVWGKFEDFYRANVFGTEIVADLCLEHGIKRLVYVSSPSVYSAKEDRLDLRENQVDSSNDLNYYIETKIRAEATLRRYQEKGLEVVILRPRGLIGIGDTSVVPRLLRANAKIGIPLLNHGQNLVDITCVENVAYACRLAMETPDIAGQIFNITNGEPMEFRTILEMFLQAIGEQPRYLKLPTSWLYQASIAFEKIYNSLALTDEPPLTKYMVCTLGYSQTLDITKAREVLGYQARKSLTEGIRDYGKWWQESKKC